MQAAVKVREKTLRITYWPLNNLILWDFDQPLQLYEVSALALKNKNKTRGSKRKKASA
jgi:TfoX/Sxy family transcriptional regulator of competence genes